MKKHLLSTSAIALGVAAAAPAAAQDWDVRFGGFQSVAVGYADVGGSLATGSDFDGVDVFTSGEISFVPSVTMDNGLTFGVNVQLETFSTGDQIDESYAFVSGDNFGTLTIGSENSEGYRYIAGVAWGLQGGNLFINSPSVSSFVPFSAAVTSVGFRQALISTVTEVGGNNDAERISYRTPDFNGFSVGVSYARDGNQDDFSSAVDTAAGTGTLHDIFDIGAGYSGSFGNTTVNLAARWGTGDVASTAPSTSAAVSLDGAGDALGSNQSFVVDNNGNGLVDAGDIVATADPGSAGGTAETWAVAADIGFGAVNFVASYAENDNPGSSTDSSGYGIGIGYDAAGPWAFALDTFFGESDAPGSQEEYEAYKLNATRDIGNGASFEVFAIFTDATNTAGTGDIDGTVIGGMLNLWF